MARKDEAQPQPVVTTLPLPSSESVLVIDLPDGQKLLVGKMSHGTVIEVATWRGTGRPDSRTNRLMLGMSSSDADAPGVASESQDEHVVDKRSIRYWIWFVKQIGKSLISFVKDKVGSIRSKKSMSELVKPSEASSDSAELDVQAWLDNLKSKSEIATSSKSTKSEVVKATPGSKKASVARKPAKKSSNRGNSRSKA